MSMYLSRLALNPALRETQRALAQPQVLHGALERAFPGKRERRLWRVDWLETGCWLLALSEDAPDFSRAQQQFGLPGADNAGEIKDYQPFLDRLEAGQRWRFRLRANPVVSVPAGEGEDAPRGKVHAHVTTAQQQEWLLKRAPAHGFSLKQDDFQVTHTQWLHFAKEDDNVVTLRAVVFEGMLEVTDVALLRATLIQGIGRGKAYGMGMLTLARPRTADEP